MHGRIAKFMISLSEALRKLQTEKQAEDYFNGVRYGMMAYFDDRQIERILTTMFERWGQPQLETKMLLDPKNHQKFLQLFEQSLYDAADKDEHLQDINGEMMSFIEQQTAPMVDIFM